MVIKVRGQSALEYLVTYGWAILAIIVIFAVLFGLGIFNPSKFVNEKQSGGFSSFMVQDFKISGTTLTLTVGNTVGRAITVTGVNSTKGGCAWSGSTAVQPSAVQTLTVTCTSVATGAEYNYDDMKLSFTDSLSSQSHTETGFLKGKGE
jgi:hypothetical protein